MSCIFYKGLHFDRSTYYTTYAVQELPERRWTQEVPERRWTQEVPARRWTWYSEGTEVGTRSKGTLVMETHEAVEAAKAQKSVLRASLCTELVI